ncbi:protein commissureless 2 homolog [Onthophagus taurus]|uniref:protein commissureless 2 homolog n=1 Tax=Onthophagus taurus TaxID=166361 RepID=UPI000C20CC63|nr:protein commissureless 2 homolog [Onthophagus taurus]
MAEEFGVSFKIPNDKDTVDKLLHRKNYTFFFDFYDELPSAHETDPEYEQFLADVWVGIVLTLMVLCCVCCMCSCLLYHKFQQWKRSVEERRREDLEATVSECESLPSYTIVSGLPTYEEALEQLKKVGELSKESALTTAAAAVPPEPPRTHATGTTVQPTTVQRLSVIELFQLHRERSSSTTANIKM